MAPRAGRRTTLTLEQLLVPIYKTCGENFHVLTGPKLGDVTNPLCTATAAPPVMPIFVVRAATLPCSVGTV